MGKEFEDTETQEEPRPCQSLKNPLLLLLLVAFCVGVFTFPVIAVVEEFSGLPMLQPGTCKVLSVTDVGDYGVLVTPDDKTYNPFKTILREDLASLDGYELGQSLQCFWQNRGFYTAHFPTVQLQEIERKPRPSIVIFYFAWIAFGILLLACILGSHI